MNDFAGSLTPGRTAYSTGFSQPTPERRYSRKEMKGLRTAVRPRPRRLRPRRSAGRSPVPAATAPPPLPRARPQRAAAQAGQRVCLIPGDADLAGQVKRPLVTRPGPVEIASEPVQRPRLVERLGFGAAIADFPVDAQPFFQVTSRAGEVPGQAPHSPQISRALARSRRSLVPREMFSASSRSRAAAAKSPVSRRISPRLLRAWSGLDDHRGRGRCRAPPPDPRPRPGNRRSAAA